MIVVIIASDSEVGCTIELDAWSGTTGTPAASYSMTEVAPTVYESANIASLGGTWRVRMKNSSNEPVATGYVSFSGATRGQVIDDPSGSGGSSGSVTVLPLNAAVISRVKETTIELLWGEAVSVAIAVTDAAGDPVSLVGRTLRVVIENRDHTDRQIIADGAIAKSENTATFTVGTSVTNSVGRKLWSLRDTSGDVVLAYGVLTVAYAPKADA